MLSNVYKNTIWLAIILLLASCKKFTEVDPPKNAIGTEQVFADDQSANSAVLGIYTTLNSVGFGYGNVTLYPGISADELIRLDPPQDEQQLMDNQILPSNEAIAGLWSDAFKVIAQANACIEGLNAQNGVTAVKKTELLAESRFLRAFCYHYLINLYGKVPLITTSNWILTKHVVRTEVEELDQLIMEDLQFAYANLPAAYASGTTARAGKWAAAAMLARVNLYNRNWGEAEKYANSVLDESGLFQGELPELEGVFLIGSAEAIWQMAVPAYWINTYEGTAFNNFGFLQYVISDDLKSTFESGDRRAAAWLDIINSNGIDYAIPAKYKANTYAGVPTERYVMLRLAEQLLIRAEAEVMSNNNAGAIADLNMIRSRAGLTLLDTGLSAAEILAAIEKENRIEFFAEWGHRWFDLKRRPALTGAGNRVDEVLSAFKPGKWQPADALYPVPQKEISLNPNLAPNNPGY
ncbi:RagB/SusD family nutrient uptake outer membrane protein [Pedobacter sp. AW31-3R]|uniref:RagB/SusD family nutrient uptake outer membrane protein n=1 Tax=Pedobacter sp. AW31-3R TaxID=3445781 RepID=UPI003F9F6D63